MKLKSIFLGGVVLGALAFLQPANAATILTQTSRTDVEAATGLSGGAVIDFESQAAGFFTQVSAGGVTFSTPTGALGVNTDYAGQAVTGFGFFFGASDLTWTLSAYDAMGGLLESVQIAPTLWSNAGDFYGLTSNGIRSARLVASTPDYVIIDDFRTSMAPLGPMGAVPEPATWAMMIIGFGAAGAMLRRRRLSLLAATEAAI